MIYLVILFLLLLFAIIYDFGDAQVGRKFIFNTILIGLICLAGFRYRVGGDTLMYMLTYSYLPDLSELGKVDSGVEKLQPLWLLLAATAKSISKEFFVLQFLQAILVNILVFGFIKANTKYVFTAIFLYFIGYYGYFNFEILRESISVAVFLYSIKYLQEKKWIIYYSLAVVALLFHFSGVILFIIPFLMRFEFKIWKALLIFGTGIMFSTVFASFVNSVNFAGGFITSMKVYTDYTPTLFGIASLFLLYVAYPTLVYKLSASYLHLNSKLINLLALSIFIGASTAYFYIFFRFLNYFTPILFIFLTEIIHGLYRKYELRYNRFLITFLLFISISFISTNKYFSSTSEHIKGSRWISYWYPYHTIFDEQIDLTRERLIKAQNQF